MVNKKIPFHTAYGEKKVVNFFTNGPSLTDPSYKDENNVKNFIERYYKTGTLPDSKRPLHYGDFSHITDYQDALNRVIQAKEKFMEFPSNVRERFNNDPNEFFNWVNDPVNEAEISELFNKKTNTPSSVPPEVTETKAEALDLDPKNPEPAAPPST